MVFTFPATVLISHLKAALRFISTDETRPHISCLRIEAHPKEIRFIATDGFRMWMASAIPMTGSSNHGEMHFSREDVQRLASKTIDRKKGAVNVESENLQVTLTQGEHVSKFREVDLTEQSYPKYDEHITLVVSEKEPRVAVSMRVSYLMDAAASFADVCDSEVVKRKGACIRVLPGKTPFDPVVVSQEGTNALVAIMPTTSESYVQAQTHVNGLIEKYKEQSIPSRRSRAG